MAYRKGDPTAKLAGRLTLNPLAHLDLLGSIVFPLIMSLAGGAILGWAKPVPVNPMNFRNPRRDDILVSIAGVAANLAAAAVAGLLFRLLSPEAGTVLSLFLVQVCIVNVSLAIFNLIPVPPLDGSHVLAQFLPYELAVVYMRAAPFGFIILLILINTGVWDLTLSPIMYRLIAILTGLPL